MEQRTLLYDERFLESYAGAIITDPATAIVELVANCWDAYTNCGRFATAPDPKLLPSNQKGYREPERDPGKQVWYCIETSPI